MEIYYCAYMDVLGYKALVEDKLLSPEKRLSLLKSIYENLATQFMIVVPYVNDSVEAKVDLRSFSDCFFLYCERPEPLLVAIAQIYQNVFGFFRNFSETEQRTPLIRCGVVRDWMAKFYDIGSMQNSTKQINPVGLSVTRAYLIGEESKLSGMRIIVSPEVIEDIQTVEVAHPMYKCKYAELKTYKHKLPYYFRHIEQNEDGKTANLYELLWPFDLIKDNPSDALITLRKLRPGFIPEKITRHFNQTIGAFIASHTLLKSKQLQYPDKYEKDHADLINLYI